MNARRRLLGAAAVAASPLGFPMLARPAFAADAGVGERELVIGQSAVLSGPLGTALKSFGAGAQLAFDEVNAAGGIAGRRLRLVALDDGLEPARAVANYKALLTEHKVFAFFGGVGSGTIAAATPLLRDSQAPMIGNYALSDAVREQARGAAYFVRATYRREAEKLVQHLATVGITRIAVAHLANPGGEEVLALVRAAIRAHGKAQDVVAAAGVRNDGGGVAEAGAALARAQPQAVIMFLTGPPIAQLMTTMWAAGSSPSFYGMSVVAGDQVARALGRSMRGLATSQVVPYPWNEADATAREFRQACTTRKTEVSYASYEGYINAMVLIEALRRAGRELSRAALHAVMKGFKARIAGIDIDFSGAATAGSRFVDLVHVTADARFRR